MKPAESTIPSARDPMQRNETTYPRDGPTCLTHAPREWFAGRLLLRL